MKAYMHGIRAILYLMTSYDLNGSFDEFENDHSMLDQYNGDFLTLRPGASSNLPNAHDDLNAILTTLSSAINFLSNELDDQSNDIILYNEVLDYDNDPENEMTLLEELSSSGNFYQAVNNTVSTEICQESCTYDSWGWYYCNDTNCQDVDININNIMNNPPNNLKALLPNYSIDMVQNLEYNWIWEDDNIELSTDGWADSNCQYGLQNNHYWIYNGNEWIAPGSNICNSITDYVQTIINNLNDNGYQVYSGSSIGILVSWDQWGETAPTHVSLNIYYTATVAEPCLEWTASSYNEWKSQWPDITINGLFPTMNNATFFGNLLEIDETQDYNQNNIVDWWEDHSDDCSD